MNAETARNHCDYYRPGGICTIMQALKTQTDGRCKYVREKPERCTYLESYVLKGRGQKVRNKRKGAV